jgi:hypothetical protein
MTASELSGKMLAYKYLKDFNIEESIDWAVDMITLGYETPSLLILAGISKPAHFFETEKYLIQALDELGFTIPSKDEALLLYSRLLIEQIAKSIDIKINLYKLCRIAMDSNYEKSIFDFYLLYRAWDDLDYGNGSQHYGPDVDRSNIETVAVATAKGWLNRHGSNGF